MPIRLLNNSPLLTMAALALAACSADPPPQQALKIEDAWARATAPGQESGGVFLRLENEGSANDRLVGGSTPVAGAVEIHSMTMDGNIMRMRREKAVELPARGSAELAPGGTHLMLMDLKAPLTVGQSFPLTLDFEGAARKQVKVRVLPIGSSGPKESRDD